MQRAVICAFHINALERVKAALHQTLLTPRSGSPLSPRKLCFTGAGRNDCEAGVQGNVRTCCCCCRWFARDCYYNFFWAFLHYRFKKKERNDRLPENCVKSERAGPA